MYNLLSTLRTHKALQTVSNSFHQSADLFTTNLCVLSCFQSLQPVFKERISGFSVSPFTCSTTLWRNSKVHFRLSGYSAWRTYCKYKYMSVSGQHSVLWKQKSSQSERCFSFAECSKKSCGLKISDRQKFINMLLSGFTENQPPVYVTDFTPKTSIVLNLNLSLQKSLLT